jgi:hypothetical protein
MTISQEHLTNGHLRGETTPAQCLNTFGRVLHRLSTMPSERPTPEEYYADQPRTVHERLGRIATGLKPAIRRVADELNPKYLYFNAGHLASSTEELAIKIVNNLRL